MLGTQEWYATVGTKDFVNGIAIEKTTVRNRNVGLVQRRDVAVDAGITSVRIQDRYP